MTDKTRPEAFPFGARSYAFQEYVNCNNLIGGRWVPAAAGSTLTIDNPRHAKAMGQVAYSGAADVAAAVEAAQGALAEWSGRPLRARAQVFYRLRELMMRDVEELSWLVSHENGKTYADGKADVEKGIECIEFAASLANRGGGEQLEVSRGVRCQVTYEPVGVCAGITPFNFPVMVPLWMIPLVLMGGNTFILKPSEQVPYGAMKIGALMAEAGLPAGVLNIVNGGRETVEALADHPTIQALAFVGSTKVARLVYARAAQTGKRALCLGGAKNHLIVVPDADPVMTAVNVVTSSFGCAGQRCMASSLVVAVGEVDHIVEAIAENVKRLELGRDVGTIINASSVERIVGYIDQAEKLGAKVLVDGRGAKGPGEGYWVGPTVLDQVTPDMPAGCEEIFGPVLSIVRAKTLDEAIALQNNSPYGNGAAIYTSSGGIARRVAARLTAGMIGVNIGVPVPREPFGFGGWKASKFGHGDITGIDGFRFWTSPRKVTAKWELQKDATWMS